MRLYIATANHSLFRLDLCTECPEIKIQMPGRYRLMATQKTLGGFFYQKQSQDKSLSPPHIANHEVEKKRKSEAEYDKAYDAKRKRGFIDTWLTDFPWLEKLQTADDLCICKLCKQFPILADQSSGLFIGQPIFRRDTLVAHEKSSCHGRCKIKCDDELRKQKKQIKVGDLDKVLQEYNHSQVNRYKKLFTTIFCFSHNVFKRLLSQSRKNHVLFGKGLKYRQVGF